MLSSLGRSCCITKTTKQKTSATVFFVFVFKQASIKKGPGSVSWAMAAVSAKKRSLSSPSAPTQPTKSAAGQDSHTAEVTASSDSWVDCCLCVNVCMCVHASVCVVQSTPRGLLLALDGFDMHIRHPSFSSQAKPVLSVLDKMKASRPPKTSNLPLH